MSTDILYLIIPAVLVLVIIFAFIKSGSASSSTRTPPPPPSLPSTPLPPTPPPPLNPLFTKTSDIRYNTPAPVSEYKAHPDWGQTITRPATIYVLHNQRDCPICKSSIDQGYSAKGWMRCQSQEKLFHAQCYEAKQAAGNAGCPVCSKCRPRPAIVRPPTA